MKRVFCQTRVIEGIVQTLKHDEEWNSPPINDQPASTGKLSGGSLRALGRAIVAPMANAAKRYQGLAGFDVTDDVVAPSPPERAPKSRDETVTLRGVAVSLDSDVGSAFITDLSRNKERLFSDQQVCEKYDIEPADWTAIAQNKALRLRVNAEHQSRMLRGTAAQESAAKIFTEAPEVLGSILRDSQASPRHRIEASKELRATSRSDDEKLGADAERVVVTINLGNAPEDKLVFDCGPPRQTTEAPDAETERW